MEQRSPEWFEARKGRVTASNVGAILGLDPNRTRKDVMRQMVRDYHGAEREWHGNIATQWGVTHEEEARMDFEIVNELTVQDATFAKHPTMNWLGASPDGYIGDDATYEAKCPFGLRNEKPPVPFKLLSEQPHYMAQIQIQLFCTERKKCYFWQWVPAEGGNSLDIVPYDPEAIAWIIPALRDFYLEYLDACENPDEYLEPERKVIDTPRALQLLAEYDDLAEAISRAEERKKEILADIVKMCGERNAVFGGRKLSKITRESTSYAEAIKVLAPGADLTRWKKSSSYWSLK